MAETGACVPRGAASHKLLTTCSKVQRSALRCSRSKQWFNRLPARCQGVVWPGCRAGGGGGGSGCRQTVGRGAEPVRWEEEG
jgi:hypothetical protein